MMPFGRPQILVSDAAPVARSTRTRCNGATLPDQLEIVGRAVFPEASRNVTVAVSLKPGPATSGEHCKRRSPKSSLGCEMSDSKYALLDNALQVIQNG